jgi:hypothetical protein
MFGISWAKVEIFGIIRREVEASGISMGYFFGGHNEGKT